MAAPSYTYVTIKDLMRRVIKDQSGDDFDFVDEDVFDEHIFKRVQKEQPYTFDLVVTGLWNYQAGYEAPSYFYGMTFDGQEDAEYKVYSSGSIKLTSGTDTSNPLIVTAGLIDFRMVMADFYFFLASNHADEIAESVQGYSRSPMTVRRELQDIAAMWQGARG